jgi:hypothetical protein
VQLVFWQLVPDRLKALEVVAFEDDLPHDPEGDDLDGKVLAQHHVLDELG